jgi:RNA-binding protein YhbY
MSLNVKKQMTMQVGKQGVTDNFIATLKTAFKTHATIRVAALKASGRDSQSIQQIADDIVTRLNGSFAYRVIGFTIILKKQSRQSKLNKQGL